MALYGEDAEKLTGANNRPPVRGWKHHGRIDLVRGRHEDWGMRIAFKMQVRQGQETEYERRHNPIWKELEEKILQHGVQTYSIFLDEATGDLFAYAEIRDWDQWQQIAETEVCRRWWDYMSPLMSVHEDKSPATQALKEVFHLESR